ncbi:MAG: type IV pilus modification PilV family protein [Candidatus Rifleibacteriota bacterium]
MLFRTAKRSAFSLVEVLLAVFIIGVGVFPVISLFFSGSRTVEKGSVVLEASIVSQNILDLARSDSFIWQTVPVTIEIPDENYPEFKLPEYFQKKYKASATLTIQEAPDHTILGTGAKETNLLQLTVILNWVESGNPKDYRLLTYRANTNSLNLKTSAEF